MPAPPAYAAHPHNRYSSSRPVQAKLHLRRSYQKLALPFLTRRIGLAHLVIRGSAASTSVTR